MSRTRKRHPLRLPAKVAVEAIKGSMALVEECIRGAMLTSNQ